MNASYMDFPKVLAAVQKQVMEVIDARPLTLEQVSLSILSSSLSFFSPFLWVSPPHDEAREVIYTRPLTSQRLVSASNSTLYLLSPSHLFFSLFLSSILNVEVQVMEVIDARLWMDWVNLRFSLSIVSPPSSPPFLSFFYPSTSVVAGEVTEAYLPSTFPRSKTNRGCRRLSCSPPLSLRLF